MTAPGIYNIGNTCYMNTALQCLGHLKPFTDIVSTPTTRGPLCRELARFFNDDSAKRTPTNLASILQAKIKSIRIREQNDVAEFISLFLDAVNRELASDQTVNMQHAITDQVYRKTPYDNQRRRMDIDWLRLTGKEHSPIVDAFYGQYISQIDCSHCHKIWHNYEIYQSISLPLPPTGNPSMNQLLEVYFKDRALTEWKCDRCSKGARSDQSIALWRNPQVLTITLQRFDVSRGISKNDVSVDIPAQLDLSKFTLQKTPGTYKKYALKSVAFHSGSYFGGHYHCICRAPDNTFVLYDDDTVVRLNGPPPDLSKGYMFFYEALG
jgi:ubiquitin carboxyl-terminal hydrolase 36/42